MNSQLFNRRQFSLTLTSFLSGLGLSANALASGGGPGSDEISRIEEAIHQEVVLKASRKRVYEALTDADQFGKATGVEGSKISREVGGAFSLFGGQIEGRHVELVPSTRIVQAWRSSGWENGKYSIARFEFKARGRPNTWPPAGRNTTGIRWRVISANKRRSRYCETAAGLTLSSAVKSLTMRAAVFWNASSGASFSKSNFAEGA